MNISSRHIKYAQCEHSSSTYLGYFKFEDWKDAVNVMQALME